VITRLHRLFRWKVEHAVKQTFIGARAAIVNFVRMQNDHLSGRAEMGCTTIGKGLDAGKRDAQRIGIVAMRRIGVAMKARLDALDTLARRCLHNPLEFARTFKIADARSI